MAKAKQDAKRNRRLGRPPGSPEEIRRNRVVSLMTDAEFALLTKISAENDNSVSAMVHQIVARFLKRYQKKS